MSRFLRASSPQWIAASIFLPSPHTLAGVARRRPVGASSSFRSGKPALSSCSKSAMTKYSFWRREHSGRRITASLDRLSGALSDRPNELLRVRRRRRLDLRCRPVADVGERPVSGRARVLRVARMHFADPPQSTAGCLFQVEALRSQEVDCFIGGSVETPKRVRRLSRKLEPTRSDEIAPVEAVDSCWHIQARHRDASKDGDFVAGRAHDLTPC